MTFTWGFNTATLVAIGVQIVIFIVYLVKTNGYAKDALRAAKSASERAEEAHEKIALVQAALALHREHVAREYHDKIELRQMEARIENSLQDMEKRLTGRIENLSRRG